MAEQQQFYLLLGNLMSPDNNVRKQAEVSGRNRRRFRQLTSSAFVAKTREVTLATANCPAARSELSRQAR